MAWSFLKRLLASGRPEPKIVVKHLEDVHVTPVGAGWNDPKAATLPHELEKELRHDLEGAHDAAEMRARLARFEREHGMHEVSSEEFVLVPDAHTVSEGDEAIRRTLEELDRELEGVTDRAERRARMERFAQEHSWRIERRS